MQYLLDVLKTGTSQFYRQIVPQDNSTLNLIVASWLLDVANTECESGVSDAKKASGNNEIRSLLNQTNIEFQNKNYDSATLLVEESYLENYEFIKTPLTEKMRL